MAGIALPRARDVGDLRGTGPGAGPGAGSGAAGGEAGRRPWLPREALFEPDALDFPLGRALWERLRGAGVAVRVLAARRVPPLLGRTPELFLAAKATLVVGVKRTLRLEPCPPSADFQFALVTGCPGLCHYCYLQTSLGRRPFVRVYVNVDEILATVADAIARRWPRPSSFEASASSDPLAVEHLTGSLARAVRFFAGYPSARLRLVTKFTAVDDLLGLPHRRRTTLRFSVNAAAVSAAFEPAAPPLAARARAAARAAAAGLPVGFVLAPIMAFPGWREAYRGALESLRGAFADPPGPPPDLTFELITYRFTSPCRELIRQRFPGTRLDLSERGRRLKFGKYGRAKFVYAQPLIAEIEARLRADIAAVFPGARVLYFT